MSETIYGNVAPLRNVASLLALIRQVQGRTYGLPGMATFFGPSGWGKTTAATYAVNRTGACHIEVKALWRTKQVLQQIAIELGLIPARTAPALFDQVAAELALRQRPLLLDEADHLCRDQMIEVVRGLHEASGVPVVLIGEELLPQKLQRWERVHGRMLAWVAVQPAELADVAHLAPIYAPGIALAEDLRAHLLHHSRRSIRRVSINLALVREVAAQQGLDRMDLAAWGSRDFFTGEAPPPRNEERLQAVRAAAAARAGVRRVG